MSTINRILNAEYVSTACFLFGSGSFFYLYGRESLFQKKYISFIQKEKDGEPVPAHNVLKFHLETVLDDLKISEYNRDYYDVFITKELDPITVGSSNVRQGVKIGIPEHYQSGSIHGVRVVNSCIHGTTIPWTSEEGEELAQALLLSDNAKRFAIAKAVLLGETYYHLFNAIFAPFFSWGYYVFTELIFSYRKLHLRSGLFTLSTYILCGILFGGVYVFCDNILYLQYDKATFEDAMAISHGYIEGAIEFSEKAVKRNKALRNIVKNGDKYYDEDGDLTSILLPTGIPVSLKVPLAKATLKDWVAWEEAMTPAPVNPNPFPVF